VHAHTISNRLNASSDNLNKTLEGLEEKFRAFDLGVEAFVDLTKDHEANEGQWRHLWFAKVGPTWRFSIIIGNDVHEDAANSTPSSRHRERGASRRRRGWGTCSRP